MTAFHVFGVLFAVWAVTVALLGIRRENFPRTPGAQRLVGAISIVLAACAIGSAVYVGATEDDEGEGGAEQALVPSH